MEDEIEIYDHSPLDDAVNVPAYLAQQLADYLSSRGIPISGQREVHPGTANHPALIELTVPTGHLQALDNSTKDFLDHASIEYQREAFGAGAITIRYMLRRPAST